MSYFRESDDEGPGFGGTLTTFDMCSPVGQSARGGGQQGASAAYPAAGKVLYIPVVLRRRVTLTQAFTYNGATAAGNHAVGLANFPDGQEIVQSTLVAQAGVSTIQLMDITDTTVEPGIYYIVMFNTLATATYFRLAPATQTARMFGVRHMNSQTDIPATPTLIAPDAGYIPICGFITKSTI